MAGRPQNRGRKLSESSSVASAYADMGSKGKPRMQHLTQKVSASTEKKPKQRMQKLKKR